MRPMWCILGTFGHSGYFAPTVWAPAGMCCCFFNVTLIMLQLHILRFFFFQCVLLSHLKSFAFRTLMMLSLLSIRFISRDARTEYVLFLCVFASHVCTWCFLRKEVIYQFYQQKKNKQGISKLKHDGWSSTCFFDGREQRNNGDITGCVCLCVTWCQVREDGSLHTKTLCESVWQIIQLTSNLPCSKANSQ